MMDRFSIATALAKTLHRRAATAISAASVLALTLPIEALAQSTASGNRHFTAAPVPKAEDAAEGDMILGIPANTIFFIAVGVIAILWFTLGGGRKAKMERPQ